MRLREGTSLFSPESKQGRQLLIVSCSDKKCPDVGDMKALDRYTGQLFSKMKAFGIPPKVDVAILSAKHGLIRSDTPIENYDQIMTDEIRDKFLKDPNELKRYVIRCPVTMIRLLLLGALTIEVLLMQQQRYKL